MSNSGKADAKSVDIQYNLMTSPPSDETVRSTEKDILVFPFSTVRVWVCCTLIMVFYIMVLIILGPLVQQYLVHRFSEEYNDNVTVNSSGSRGSCDNSTVNDGGKSDYAQRETSTTLLYAAFAACLPSIFACLFAGSLSDFLGRKFLLIYTIAGGMAETINLCFIIKFDLEIWFIYLGSSLNGITGSFYTLVLVITAAIADITTDGEKKALHFAIIEIGILVCGALGQIGTGYFIETAGFFYPVLMCACLLGVCLLIAIFILPETLRQKQAISWNMVTHLKKTFSFYYSAGSVKYSRLMYNIGMWAYIAVCFANLGKSNVETMYQMNEPICWDSVEIGIFGAVRMVVLAISAVVLLKVCKKRLSLELTAIICAISGAAGFVIEGFADSTVMMYISFLVGIFYTATLPLPRAALSLLAPPSEQGALFSSMACLEAAATMSFLIVYTTIYKSTLDTFRGAAFMVMAGACLLNAVLFVIYRCLRLSSQKFYDNRAYETDNLKNVSQEKDFKFVDVGVNSESRQSTC